MKRRIIEIDKDKCNGCGACAAACHEGAIAMVDGKAQLMRDDYCDGLGDCLPACGKRYNTCNVSSSEIELRTIVVEERCMTSAFFLSQNINLTVEFGVRMN